MATIKCKMCGGTMEITNNSTVAVCEYCGTQQTIPRLSDERKANLYDRANHFRRNNEFDKAQGIYEQILNEDPNDAESYWSLVLCKYGIEYVEDPKTHKRVPTVNRTQFTSLFEDSNYKEAIRLSDADQKQIYEEEAKAIDDIQKGILQISRNEKPFDVFICYKETDENGKRTRDSVLAQEMYNELTEEGFKVFFSRITLQSKLGTAYEPYIFAALNSSKVMVVVGTKPEFFKSVWVKNEWSRFLDMIKRGEKKTLIPAYRGMDPYDLPEEFSFLQAQDMSKLGFMQDLIAGIKKILGGTQRTQEKNVPLADTYRAPVKEAVQNPLLTRAYLFLEDGDFNQAEKYVNKVLDMEPENPLAYLALVLIKKGLVRTEDLFEIPEDELMKDSDFKKAVRFSDDEFRREYVEKRKAKVGQIEADWAELKSGLQSQMDSDDIELVSLALKKLKEEDVVSRFSKLKDYSETVAKEETYYNARKTYCEKNYQYALSQFLSIEGWKDSEEWITQCRATIQEKESNRKRNWILFTFPVVFLIVVFFINRCSPW